MDMDLWIKFIMAGIRQRRINAYCWAFRMHDDSKTAEFDTHKVVGGAKNRLDQEKRLCSTRAGYKMSQLMYLLCMLFRVFDGSLARGFYNRCRFRRYAI